MYKVTALLDNLTKTFKKIILVQIPKLVPVNLLLSYWLILSKIQGKLTGHHYIYRISRHPSALSNEIFLLKMTDGNILVQNQSRISRFIRGRDYALNRLLNQYLFAIDLKDLTKMGFDNLMFDIGANIGEFSIGIALNTDKINIFAFEPDPIAYECLNYNIIESNCQDKIKPVFMALSNRSGVQTFYLSTNGADSSLFQPTKFDSKIEIECTKGEDFLNKFHIKQISFLKMDAEGFEPEVLQGFGNRIRDIKFFAIDVGPERDGLETDIQVSDLLLKNGAKISHCIKEGKRKFLNANW
jgi:FkbM family methyltransferase